tara:strand:+ start:1099 stop:2253 length:1155 start_codon:yes stop_codon:yes gene_type:complete
MKKILIIHTKYRNFGGEDTAVKNEEQLLSKYYKVKVLYFKNNITNYVNDPISFLSRQNKNSMKILQNEINEFQPDIAYVHNTWFKASLGVFKVLKRNNINTLLKLHNFRYRCTKSYFSSEHFKGNTVCNACGLEKKKVGVFNKYYTESYLKSLFLIHYGRKYFALLKNSKFNILVLTKYHKDYLIDNGIEESRLDIFPNHIDTENKSVYDPESKYLVYAGRISNEKGLVELIEAFIKYNNKKVILKIIGNGPILNEIKLRYSKKNIEFLGEIENSKVLKEIRKARAVITATKLLEGQPMLLCEASINGVPSIFPKFGGISEFFPIGYKFSYNQFDYLDLDKKFNLLEDKSLLTKNGQNNRKFISSYLDEKKLIYQFEEYLGTNE